MENGNPIRTFGDYFRPSHEEYRYTIELPKGNNVVPLRSKTIRLVQNECSFPGLRSEDLNQYIKDFLKIVDSLDHNVEIRERTRLCLFQSPFAIKLAIGLNVFPQNPSPLVEMTLRDFAKLFKAISLPQDVPSTSDRRLIDLENQVQRLMEAYLAPNPPIQVNKIASSCEICSDPHDT
ncbi:hypothetical protein Tco_0749115 [Tanacetum coccineum]|uniref:Uncharacterized protein n=1 Tax=Tanacetum coccineum TaxID=301880 RepID=A0ABQ4YXN3_9ASTR